MTTEVASELGGGRITRIDGIRAVAVVLVFAFHTGFVNYGWLGVHLFFVLSGFLITGILRRMRDEPHFWAPFYIKRAARILPPLLLVFGAAAYFYHAYPTRRPAVALDMLFLSNVAQVLYPKSDYNLGLLWSLAVEEHFYLLWPIAIRFLSRTSILRILAVVIVLEPIARGIMTPFTHDHNIVFYLTPFQLDGLAAGSLLALLVENSANTAWLRRYSGWATFISGLLIATLYPLVPSFNRDVNSILFNSIGYSLIILFGFALLAFTLFHPKTLLVRILDHPWIVFVGTISYGIYLFHPLWLSFFIVKGHKHGIHHDKLTAPFALLTTILMAWLSFHFYEKPIIAWGRKLARRYEHGNHTEPASALVTTAK